MSTFDGGDDLVGSAVQEKRLGCRIMLGGEAVDGRLKVDDTVKAFSLEASLLQPGEEDLKGVEPDTLPSRLNRSDQRPD